MAKIVFKINGKEYEADESYGPDVSLNEFIRTVADLRGTKVMCQEGGCGACIVAVKAPVPPTNEVKIFSVNSCLVSIFSCQGWEITTVEGIGNKKIGYHKIQKTLADFNGTQCGYCTSGWIMSMFSVYESKNKKVSSKEVENSFSSNICRCTGYRSIADAFKSLATDADKSLITKLCDIEELGVFKSCAVKCTQDNDWCVLEKDNSEMLTIDSGDHKWIKVYNLKDAFKAIEKYEDYKLVAGNTGQGVYHVTEYPKYIIDIFNVAEMKGYTIDVNLILGAGMTLTEMMEVFLKLSSENEDFAYLKELYNHMDLVAHIPVRNIGSIGGNLYLKFLHKEFPSDVFLLFETVGAMVTVANSPTQHETITLLNFLSLDMNKKIIVNVMLPPLSSSCLIKTYKIMPRSQNAHAIVNAGFLFKINEEKLENATIVYGNITPKFVHATKTEEILIGKDPFTDSVLQTALKTLYGEINPDTLPPEPSAEYRKLLAVSLYYKAILKLCPEGRLDKKYSSGGNVIKRETSKGTQIYDTDKSVWPLNKPVPKLEALVQCSGEAIFANDLPTQINEVFGAFVTADVNPGSIISGFDTTEALKIPGVLAFYSAKDIPGKNNYTPSIAAVLNTEEEIVCSKKIKFYGQPVGIIVANREKTAFRAAKNVKIKYEEISTKLPLLTIQDVLLSSERERITTDVIIEPTANGNDIKKVIKDELIFETQYHYYMEPQTCVVKPTEDGLEVYASTQWLSLVNVAIAQCLNVPVNSINVVVRRVGGAYGGKVVRSAQIACAAALVTHLQGLPCRFVLPMEKNMSVIGKRASAFCKFEAGVNDEGAIQYLKIDYYQDNGCSKNETITTFTTSNLPNCYDSSRWYIKASNVLTDIPSTAWCRAPGSTEGVAISEYIMEKIARDLNKDPIQVRKVNMKTENNPIPDLIEQLKMDSDFDKRLLEVESFNNSNRWRKRVLKLMPMVFKLIYDGPYNSVVSIYHTDGTVNITHGYVDMGQGLNTKVAQVCAYILGIPLEKVSVKPSSTVTSPNCLATGGSIGSDCSSYTTMKACQILLDRLKPIREKMQNASWEQIVQEAFTSGIDLQATYLYTTNEPVKPYDIYGVIAMEAEVDILTGNHDIRRVDLLEDTGRSLSPEIDVGQIEGAFIMGLGLWTSEKTVYEKTTGKLLTDRTWTYKPPGIKDIPADFRIYFRRNGTNEFGVLQAKGTGEPALCLATVVTHAFREAVRLARLDAGYDDQWVHIDNPCTSENVFMAVEHKLEHFKLK